MIFILIFVIVGVAIGMAVPVQFFAISSFYVSVGILAAIDSIIGALKASYDDDFDLAIFASGLFINMLMAMVLSWLGDKLGIPLYYAAIFVFGTRLFNNLALIRRRIIENWRAGMARRIARASEMHAANSSEGDGGEAGVPSEDEPREGETDKDKNSDKDRDSAKERDSGKEKDSDKDKDSDKERNSDTDREDN